MKAINIILDEHRSLAAVLGGMVHLVRDIGEGRSPPDFRVFGTMIYYIDAFPERFHHPKEDAYLFRILRQRDAGAGALIDRLQAEHRAGEDKIRALAHALVRYQYGGADEFGQFAAAVEGYAAFHWEHMRAEEDRIPLALPAIHMTRRLVPELVRFVSEGLKNGHRISQDVLCFAGG